MTSDQRTPAAYVSSLRTAHLLVGMAFAASICQSSQCCCLLFLAHLQEGNNPMRLLQLGDRQLSLALIRGISGRPCTLAVSVNRSKPQHNGRLDWECICLEAGGEAARCHLS